MMRWGGVGWGVACQCGRVCGLVWYGAMWRGVVWYDAVWRDAVRVEAMRCGDVMWGW